MALAASQLASASEAAGLVDLLAVTRAPQLRLLRAVQLQLVEVWEHVTERAQAGSGLDVAATEREPLHAAREDGARCLAGRQQCRLAAARQLRPHGERWRRWQLLEAAGAALRRGVVVLLRRSRRALATVAAPQQARQRAHLQAQLAAARSLCL